MSADSTSAAENWPWKANGRWWEIGCRDRGRTSGVEHVVPGVAGAPVETDGEYDLLILGRSLAVDVAIRPATELGAVVDHHTAPAVVLWVGGGQLPESLAVVGRLTARPEGHRVELQPASGLGHRDQPVSLVPDGDVGVVGRFETQRRAQPLQRPPAVAVPSSPPAWPASASQTSRVEPP